MKKPDRCPVCGASGPMTKAHIVPRSMQNSRTPNNLIYLCGNCHMQMDRGILREFEFVRVLVDLMRVSGAYKDIFLEPDISDTHSHTRLRPDIVARTSDGSRKLLIECKSGMTVAQNRLDEAMAQLSRYQQIVNADNVILALPARLTSEQRNKVEGAGFEAWDLDAIASRFHVYIETVTHPVLRPLLLAVATLAEDTAAPSAEALLLAELHSLPSGRADWVAYQKLVSRILERLFCPPLSSPIIELSDEASVNRRDIILPNYAESGFWTFVRGRYCADFIVADAKNHSGEIGKSEALQVLNYLKRHGAGLLGLIVSRHGADESCLHTIREHWVQDGKLIVILSDEHIERMLLAKESGGPPEDVIRQWIEDFRLSL